MRYRRRSRDTRGSTCSARCPAASEVPLFPDIDGHEVTGDARRATVDGAAIGKGGFRHYMEKELHEHPAAITGTLDQITDPARCCVVLPPLPFDFADVPRVSIAACGSGYYAGLVGRSWLESLARLPTDVDIASEFRYRQPPLCPGELGLLVSQSGETADTLAALRAIKASGHRVVSILNTPESAMARESDAVLITMAGPEIGVASTKAFTAQLTMLICLAIAAGRCRHGITPAQEHQLVTTLLAVPDRASELLAESGKIARIADRIAEAHDVLYLGRGTCYPIALEGALKLKEISYIHAEGYAAGEMKHGSIALVDSHVPVVGIAPSGPLFEKTASNLHEARARGGQLVVFSDEQGAGKLRGIAAEMVVLPVVDPVVAPIVYAIAVQVLAYHVAVIKGIDVDHPRHPAKLVPCD